jgi:hypothetical protein
MTAPVKRNRMKPGSRHRLQMRAPEIRIQRPRRHEKNRPAAAPLLHKKPGAVFRRDERSRGAKV